MWHQPQSQQKSRLKVIFLGAASPYNRKMRRCFLLLSFVFLILRSVSTYGQSPPAFDLMGPKVDVRVKRGEVTLPIGQVPNLLPGDRLWIHPDFPDSQSTRFVLIVSFLRGATNPPPPDWFTRVDTWSKKAREEGVFVTVPDEAQQAIVFLAPATGGDFSTLRNAVKGETRNLCSSYPGPAGGEPRQDASRCLPCRG